MFAVDVKLRLLSHIAVFRKCSFFFCLFNFLTCGFLQAFWVL